MFSSRTLLNLGLVILLAGLAALAFIDNSKPLPVSDFSLLKAADITNIQIKHKDIVTEINKRTNNWQISQPIAIEADEFRINAILAILSSHYGNHYDISEPDYKKFSLAPPLATLSLNHQLFSFGSTSPVNNKRYVLTNNKLFLLDDTFYPLIASGSKNLMRRYLFVSHTQLNKISFDDRSIFLNKKSGWQSDNQDIGPDALKKFIDNWLHIQAYAVTYAKAPYAGTAVTFTTIDNHIIKLLIQKTDFNTIVTNPELGLSYQFASTAFTALTQPSHFTTNSQ